MNRPTLFVLIALNALLAMVLVGEWLAESEMPAVISQTKTDNSESEESLPELDLSATSEDSYSDLVERPMFIKGRKPVNEPVPETVPVAAVKKVEAFVWELTGVFATPKGVTAFFSRTNAKIPKDNYRKYKVGEELDGWKVTEIHTDNVILTQANETKTLPLRKLKPKMSVPVAIMNGNNRVPQPPPQQEISAAAQKFATQVIRQEMQNLQMPEAMQNNVAPESETTEETVNPENP